MINATLLQLEDMASSINACCEPPICHVHESPKLLHNLQLLCKWVMGSSAILLRIGIAGKGSHDQPPS